MSTYEKLVLAFSRKIKVRLENAEAQAKEANESAVRLAHENKKLSALNEELAEKNGNLAASHRDADTKLATAKKRIKTLEAEKAQLQKEVNRNLNTEITITDHLNKEHPDVMASVRKQLESKKMEVTAEPDPELTTIGAAPQYEAIDKAAKTAATEIGKKASKRAASPSSKG